MAEQVEPVWAHAVNSKAKLEAAISNPNITSIECDVMLSLEEPDKNGFPILSHPPNRSSDLTLETLLNMIITSDNTEQSSGSKSLTKNLKLDFKEIQVLKPSLDLLRKQTFENSLKKWIIFNADILPGPGRRELDPTMVPADKFISTCLEYIEKETQPEKGGLNFAFSLGYRCDWKHSEGYQISDVEAMKDIIETYQLALTKHDHIKIILALNARLLTKNVSIFDSFLLKYDTAEILAWTGSGEPPIPVVEVEQIRAHFSSNGLLGRIELDCCIEEHQL